MYNLYGMVVVSMIYNVATCTCRCIHDIVYIHVHGLLLCSYTCMNISEFLEGSLSGRGERPVFTYEHVHVHVCTCDDHMYHM